MRHLLASVMLASLALPASAQLNDTHDFRNANFDEAVMRYTTPTANTFLAPEKEGLRLRYTGAEGPKNPAGVAWHVHARGDFVTTVRYEILNVARPPSGWGVGVEMYLAVKNEKKGGVAFGRLLYHKGEPAINFHYLTDEDGRRVGNHQARKPTTDASLRGRLRLARTGAMLTASFAEGDAGPFVTIQEFELGRADIEVIRVAGLTGGYAEAVLDMRVIEFNLSGTDLGYKGKFTTPAPDLDPRPAKADALIAKIEAAAPVPVAVAPPRTNLVLFVVIAALVLVPLIVMIAVAVVLRWRKPAGATSSAGNKT